MIQIIIYSRFESLSTFIRTCILLFFLTIVCVGLDYNIGRLQIDRFGQK